MAHTHSDFQHTQRRAHTYMPPDRNEKRLYSWWFRAWENVDLARANQAGESVRTQSERKIVYTNAYRMIDKFGFFIRSDVIYVL